MEFVISYIRQRRRSIGLFLGCCLIFLCTFLLYHLPWEAVIYPAMLCAMILVGFGMLDFLRAKRKHQQLLDLQRLSAELMQSFPVIDTVEDKDYQEVIRLLCQEQATLQTSMNARYEDMMNYYTVWAHQIKTPIASMRLHLQNEDSEFSRRVAEELQRIEQYVEMVLMFLRLDSDSTDYVIRECDLDEIVRAAVRKFSTQFIRRKIKLCYEPLEATVITDEKWLTFVVEQVLSNSLKYTDTGTITISMKKPKTLCISDTGIGIVPEDLPRIFEKGYTGYNGRNDKKASGIGLYLCKRICKNLGHGITATSVLDKGTAIEIDLMQEKQVLE